MSTKPEYYFIKSQLSGLVLDVEDGNPLPSTWVSPWGKNGSDAQQWYDDPATGTIRSKLNDLCMDIESARLVLNPYQSGKQTQQWQRKGKLIANRIHSNIVLDIFGNDTKQRAAIITRREHGGKNQLWTFELI